jgi:hypothetical protein
MNFNLKIYKHFQIKRYFKTMHFFCFFHGTSISNENWIKIEQIFANNNLTYFRIFNRLMINTLKNSIFKNLAVLIHGPMFILNNKNSKLTFKELDDLSPLISLLGFRLNNKVYSTRQIKNLKKTSYLKNVVILRNSIKAFTKLPYRQFKSKNLLPVSK